MLRKTILLTNIGVSIREDLLKVFRATYDKEYFKGDSEAVNFLIKKYVSEKNDR